MADLEIMGKCESPWGECLWDKKKNKDSVARETLGNKETTVKI